MQSKCLIANVDNEIVLEDEKIKFDHRKITALKEFVPFHDDIDIDARLPKQSATNTTTALVTNIDNDESDPFIVNEVINKRFNAHKVQYEF